VEKKMLELFHKGGPIMWPLFLTSVISLAVVIERLFFIAGVRINRQPRVVENVLAQVEEGNIEAAVEAGEHSRDFVARTLVYGLKNRDKSFTNALLRAANKELKHFHYGLSVLDTVITLAPLLGLLSTVTGMIHAFGILGNRELDAPAVITGGIAEALIGTAFGLGIAVIALIPFNFLNARLEEARHEIEDASTHLELLLKPSNEFKV
jgi:biopolymer transport protein ExbB